MNSYILSTIFAVLTLVQFPLTLICFTIAFTQIYLAPLLPKFRAKDFSLTNYLIQAAKSALWLVGSSSIVFLFYFGSIVNEVDFINQVRGSLVNFMLDYECMGSRVWPFLLAVVVPNLSLTFKILTN